MTTELLNIARLVKPEYKWQLSTQGEVFAVEHYGLMESRKQRIHDFTLDDPADFLAAWQYLIKRNIYIDYAKGTPLSDRGWYWWKKISSCNYVFGNDKHKTKEQALEAAFAALDKE
jgi:hypothetical protein